MIGQSKIGSNSQVLFITLFFSGRCYALLSLFTSLSKVCKNAWFKTNLPSEPGMFFTCHHSNSLCKVTCWFSAFRIGSLPVLGWYWIFNIPIWYGYLIFFEICIPWQYGYWGKLMKPHTRLYQYVQILQFSHNGMSIMVLRCVILEGYIVSIWICWSNVWCHKLKGKNPWWTFLKNSTKH